MYFLQYIDKLRCIFKQKMAKEQTLYYNNLSIQDILYLDKNGIEKTEQWKDVVGYEGLYMVSDLGRVKGLHRKRTSISGKKMVFFEKIITQNISTGGYVLVSLSNGYKNIKKVRTHRIVAIAFISNADKAQVNHINGIKTDNRVVNLEWATSQENVLHAINNNLYAVGERSSKSKLTNEQVIEIFTSLMTTKDLMDIYMVSKSCINCIKNGNSWSSITGKRKKAKLESNDF
jgi:hypothetical protein